MHMSRRVGSKVQAECFCGWTMASSRMKRCAAAFQYQPAVQQVLHSHGTYSATHARKKPEQACRLCLDLGTDDLMHSWEGTCRFASSAKDHRLKIYRADVSPSAVNVSFAGQEVGHSLCNTCWHSTREVARQLLQRMNQPSILHHDSNKACCCTT